MSDPRLMLPPESQSDPAPSPPQAAWEVAASVWTLRLGGDWRALASPVLPPAPAATPPAPLRLQIEVAAHHLSGWDARFVSALWQLLSSFDVERTTFVLDSLPPGLQRVLSLSLPKPADDKSNPVAAAAPPGWFERAGARVLAAVENTRLTFEFIGQTVLAAARALRGRSDMRAADFAWQLDQTGPRSLPIVALVCLMVGLILAYMSGAQLQRFGAKSFVAELMALSIVREVAALLTGILLAGRVGAAFAAQLASMNANEEIDALRSLGVDPYSHLVLPRVLALLVVAPLLTAFAAAVGLATGWVAAGLLYGVASAEYISRSLHVLTLPHIAVGLIKGTVYGVLVALAGCRQGLASGKSAQAVGQATTQAVVTSVVWMVTAASLLTVLLHKLGL